MLDAAQRDEFFDRGFTRVEGAIPPGAISAMVSKIWEALGGRHGILRYDSGTWIEGAVRGIGDLNRQPEFRPFGTRQIEQAVSELLRSDDWTRPSSWGQILVTFPAEGWSWNSLFQRKVDVAKVVWHTDYPYSASSEALCGVQIFGLLADLESGGGGTMVIERSHHVIREFVRTQSAHTLSKMKRARAALMASDPWFHSVSEAVSCSRPDEWLESQAAVVNGIPLKVSELTGRAGDVFFTHPWLLHAGSPNCNSTPRLVCTQRVYL